MDRPEPGLVKWSPNASVDSFVHINLQHRVVQLYEPTGHARKGRFDYAKVSRHDDFPPLTTYDWSPENPSLLAVGTGDGIVNLLRIDDNSNAYVEIGLKMARMCQAVSFNTTGLLAVGLDRVRLDQSLQVWDINRLSSAASQRVGFPDDVGSFTDPRYRLEPSVSVSSIKFFEDSPQVLVAGIKGQGVRIHDLRDPTNVTTFQTRCNNNLSIDYADQNYFASSALDHPGLMIWDRRASTRAVGSYYTQAVEQDELPWGGALRLDRVVETEHDPSMAEEKHSLIRSLRYCRDHRGFLAVLSRNGQLKVLDTKRENPTSDMVPPQEGPELLQVQRSYEMDVSYQDTSRKSDRIVSFDWVTLGSPSLRPRLLVLRANGDFEILEQPSRTADHIFKLVPWQAPHRGLIENTPYHDLMQFEPSQASEMLAPVITEQILSDVPIFGPEKEKIESRIEAALDPNAPVSATVVHLNKMAAPLPDSFTAAQTASEKIRSLRAYLRDEQEARRLSTDTQVSSSEAKPAKRGSSKPSTSIESDGLGSCREMHEALLSMLRGAEGLPREAQCVVDNIKLLRAREAYLFDPVKNRNVVSDDPWKRFVWDWIEAEDGGMLVSNMDLSYLGVHSIWMNDLESPANTPDAHHWERVIGQYCKKKQLPRFDAVPTKKPYHRQLCLEVCKWGNSEAHDPDGIDREVDPEYPAGIHTMSASRALFRGDMELAIDILKKASRTHSELLFVSLALQLMERGSKKAVSKEEHLDIEEAVASKTDPYLRAISSLIATGDWTIIANQSSLPLVDRAYVAFRNFSDDQLTAWLEEQVARAKDEGDIEGICLTGITDAMVDIFAKYVEKFHDYQTATLVLSICAPRYIDDIRCRAWRNAYRAHLQRHKFFFQRTKFEVESMKRSKRDGVPTLKPPSRQIALRCVYCDASTSLAAQPGGPPLAPSSAMETRNPMLATSINAGASCPSCGRHLPRCVVCLEVVGIPRSDRPEAREETAMAGRFPTFCLKCEHVLHLDHARAWFQRHAECPVPECRCRCNYRANQELKYH
ncbi:SEH-associated protein 4 [Escovopsis weberi]|uniref:SEH-associated protein 4 n=1 Tax=Escovopsis weberi TaxID=150374 RepID=A0A0M8MUR6_ESCWE|nr:SEH-associated protein 4 [Escovopsis weberi]